MLDTAHQVNELRMCPDEHADNIEDGLPSQKVFLTTGLVRSTTDTARPPPGSHCGVCLEDLIVSTKPFGPGATSMSTIVYLQPCTHFFHHACIAKWHNSTRPERDTCPICRRVLFVSDALPPEQTHERLLGSALRPGPHRQPGPDEVLMPWETFFTDAAAFHFVDQEMERVRAAGGEHQWVKVHIRVRDAVLARGGPLRSIFEPFRNTFVLSACADSVLFAIARHDPALEEIAFRTFNDWLVQLEVAVSLPYKMELRIVAKQCGLFEKDYLRVIVAPKQHVKAREEQVVRMHGFRLRVPQPLAPCPPTPCPSFCERLRQLLRRALAQGLGRFLEKIWSA